MFGINKLILSIIFACQLFSVWCDNDLVFVIDDTGSMMDDIDQVKTQVDELFDAAVKSNSSKIADFLIVTFNDPDVKDRVKTNDRQVFKKALDEITVDGGGDCPEMALTGLELALQKSRNNSIVYLFTDATAKDADKFETVKALAKEKKCKLYFMLTGNCYGDQDRSFFDLAEATGGQVFSLFKKEVGQMLGLARETIAGGYAASVPVARVGTVQTISTPKSSARRRLASVASGTGGFSSFPVRSEGFAPGAAGAPGSLGPDAFEYAGSFDLPSEVATSNFEIKESAKEALVSVAGKDPEVEVTGPDGSKPKTVDVVSTSGSKVFKIIEAKPGNYSIKVTSVGPSSVVINTKLDA